MSMRIVALGMALVCGLSVWAWCRPCGNEVHAQGAGQVVPAEGASGGGTQEEALARYRCNGAKHWRQVALNR
ncbi:MAG: hypothetical protein C0467_01340 [Planctomycetaceae bacterium]|nr:hypothetical protein [Planctomycetaceae bacterium]